MEANGKLFGQYTKPAISLPLIGLHIRDSNARPRRNGFPSPRIALQRKQAQSAELPFSLSF
jgi:hypothetical protein